MKKQIIFILLSTFFLFSALGQVPRDSEPFLVLKMHDSIFFEHCFNLCDMDYLMGAIHKDLEFYHDRTGLQNRDVFIEQIQTNICSNPNKKPIRKVDENSLEVYPLYDHGKFYGVIQTGIHSFYLREPGKEDVLTGKAKFTHLYLWIDEKWILRLGLSFDHQ